MKKMQKEIIVWWIEEKRKKKIVCRLERCKFRWTTELCKRWISIIQKNRNPRNHFSRSENQENFVIKEFFKLRNNNKDKEKQIDRNYGAKNISELTDSFFQLQYFP